MIKKKVACVRAHDANGCGAAALATVARHYGLYVSLEWLRGRVATDLQGTHLSQLLETAKELGFSGSCGKAKPGIFDDLPLPAIVHFNHVSKGHLVVVHQIKKESIVIADPAIGVVHLRRDTFFERWSGFIVLLKPGPDFKAKGQSYSPLIELVRTAFLQRGTLCFSLILAFLLVGLGFATSLLAQLILDRVLPNADVHLLWVISLAALACMGFRFAAGFVRQVSLATLSYETEVSLGLPYTRKVLSLPLEFFERRSTGDIFARATDVTSISNAISRTLVSVLPDTFFLLSSSIVLLYYSAKLTLALFCFLPVLAVIILFFVGPLNRKERQIRECMTEWANRFIEVMQNIKTIKAFSSEDFAYTRMAEIYRQSNEHVKRRSIISDLMGALSSLITSAASVCLLWLGALMAIKGSLTTGQLIFFYSSVGMFLSSIERLPGSISSLQEATIGIERLHEIGMLESENDATGETTVLQAATADGQIEFCNVTFWHRRNTRVLTDINFRIEPGEWLGILGETGSGKSTLASLIAGLYPPRDGKILINGTDIAHVTKDSLRKYVAIVFQDARLMRGTIHENISLGDPSISRESVREAARLAHVEEFINKLPGNYDYDVGAFGSLLSSGQRQRITIARALLRKPAILILDEATSNLDVHTEMQILETVKQARKNQTTLVITHRLSTALLADRILVLHSGCVVEHGRHQELLARDGHYRSMWQTFAPAYGKNLAGDERHQIQAIASQGPMLV